MLKKCFNISNPLLMEIYLCLEKSNDRNIFKNIHKNFSTSAYSKYADEMLYKLKVPSLLNYSLKRIVFEIDNDNYYKEYSLDEYEIKYNGNPNNGDYIKTRKKYNCYEAFINPPNKFELKLHNNVVISTYGYLNAHLLLNNNGTLSYIEGPEGLKNQHIKLYLETKLSNCKNVVNISSGNEHTIILYNDGTIECFGENYINQCDIPEGIKDVAYIYAYGRSSYAITCDGKLHVWGDKNDTCHIRAKQLIKYMSHIENIIK